MKKLIAKVLVLCLLLSISTTYAFAIDVPDMSRNGSISVTMTYNDEPIPGGTLTAYRVAEIKVDNGADYSYAFTADYAECEASLADITSATLAGELAGYTAEKTVEGTELAVSEEGTVKFEGLDLGLYLLVQENAADGFSKVSPFVVSIPGGDAENGFVYDVDATPKVEEMPEAVETEPEDTTTPETEPEEEDELPQTGLTQWPIPVLAVTGLTFVVFGLYLVLSKKKKYEN